ncbi:MAG: right-handed parallel beta-helix repeat-containing protein [Verrucomicrobia bacterium]|nr:right-handed parallel beta-helix repeat-containing protein [Verrucomicrobiota bacterium]MCH8514498.1 right-handed parallel beta-helix repeat-containing protein [Kiritimatiellia bacterium]
MHIHLSPNGHDQNPGTESLPFASLVRARDAVRHALRDPARSGDIDVILHPGTYRLENTLVLGLEDAPREGDRRVRWRAAEAGTARISGALPLTGWQKCDAEPDFLPPNARGKVWTLTLPENACPRDLFRGETRIPRARGPGFKPTQTDRPLSPTTFSFPPHALQNWPDLREAELVTVPKFSWTMNILPLAEVDEDTLTARTALPCTYPIGVPGHDATFEHTLWAENTLAALAPGTWVFHRHALTLYFCTDDAEPPADLVAASLTEFIRIEGQIDQPGLEDQPVRNLSFEGLVFEHGNRFPFHGLTGKGMQHDWEMYDAPSAMLRLRGAEHCHIENCSFQHSGSSGLRMDLRARHNHVRSCRFQHLGGCGIVLCGHGPGLKYANRENHLTDNHLHHLGEHYWHAPAIFVWQSGANRIAHNHLHDLPYTAIVCSGRVKLRKEPTAEGAGTIRWHEVDGLLGADYHQPPWYHGWLMDWWRREPLQHARENLIEHNHIHDVMQIMGDGNGIYVSGGGGGNVVRFNRIGPCPSHNMAEGIRCDDDQHQTLIHGNLIFGMGGHATGITLKGVNRVTNNILALPLTTPRRGMLSLENGPQNGSVIQHNVFLTQSPEQAFAWQSRIHGDGRRALLRDADCNHNLYWCLDDPQAARDHLDREQAFGIEFDGLVADPGFTDPHRHDFSLKPDSPLRDRGFDFLGGCGPSPAFTRK